MLDLFINLDKECSIMLTSNNNIILFDTFEYKSLTLDRLYNLIKAFEIDKVSIITHAKYSTNSCKSAYKVGVIHTEDNDNFGWFSQSDINKIADLFVALNINNVKVYDAMLFYENMIEEDQCGVIANLDDTYTILSKHDSHINMIHTSRDLLEQNLLKVCHDNGCNKIINYCDFVDYDCIKGFSNYTTLTDIMLYAILSLFGFFRFISNECGLNLKDMAYCETETPTVSKSANSNSTIVSGSNSKAESTNIAEQMKKSVLKDSKVTVNRGNKLLSAVIVILLLLTVGSCVISIRLENKSAKLYNEMAISQDKVEHLSKYIDKLNEKIPSDYCSNIQLLHELCPFDSQIGNIVVDNDYEILYYVAETNSIDDVINAYNDLFLVNGISDGGIVTLNDITYAKYTVSVSKK